VDDLNTPAPSGTGTSDQVRVVLADDEALMRAGLRLMIDGSDGIEVVGEAADGTDAVTAVQELAPDVVLMDVRMPHMDGIEATRAIMAPEAGTPVSTRIVMLTAFDTDEFLLDALRAGAVSFLLKDSPPEQVIRAVHEAAGGTPQFSPTVLQRLIRLARAHGADDLSAQPAASPEDAAASTSEVPAPAVPGATPISTREWEVARLVAQGRTNSEIAEQLFLSLPTVKTHIAHLFEKLQVTNRVQLAIRVLEEEGRA
jgi:DNA-binding NarL/FixJ family response regulator